MPMLTYSWLVEICTITTLGLIALAGIAGIIYSTATGHGVGAELAGITGTAVGAVAMYLTRHTPNGRFHAVSDESPR